MDDDGISFWYENEPYHNGFEWFPNGGRKLQIVINGSQTLTERPK